MKRTTIKIGVVIQVGWFQEQTPPVLGLITRSLDVRKASRLANSMAPFSLLHHAQFFVQLNSQAGVIWRLQQYGQAWHWHITKSRERNFPFFWFSLKDGEFSRSPRKLPLESHESKLVHIPFLKPITDRGDEIMLRQFRLTLKVQRLQWEKGDYLKNSQDLLNSWSKNWMLNRQTVVCLPHAVFQKSYSIVFKIIFWNTLGAWLRSAFYKRSN